ncbi:MAG: class I SAM-dependent methyltransferase [Planctomycetota bacterium]|nr:MAG: class I SAM-dependent methyltransferase [Planctomycetota bacterium]
MSAFAIATAAVERGLVPDACTRMAIRRLCGARLRERSALRRSESEAAFQESLRSGPIAPVPEKANEQHYELPVEFFAAVLGPRRKYSCCYWEDGCESLAAAEAAALERTCRHAALVDGQQVLELGCGWGSLSLWMAEHYPTSRITAVSNSRPQRLFIEREAARCGLSNLRVVTADMNDFAPRSESAFADRFDRVVSVEMFEHMRNYDLLLRRIASWLRPGGQLFVHVFCHRELAYPFETTGATDWMGRHFFTGGIMPSQGLLSQFGEHFQVDEQWIWSGEHYRRTAEAWLTNLDARRGDVLDIFRSTYGRSEAARWFQRWRVFFLAVAEMFGYEQGRQWHVAHYALRPSSPGAG